MSNHNDVSQNNTNIDVCGKTIKYIENIIFNVRWLLIPFYFGLIISLGAYVVSYFWEIYDLISKPIPHTETMMFALLAFVDVVMVANLVKMIITGSYNSFVSKNHGFKNENISSGMLKVKMSTSIIGVSSIHLLQSFVNVNNVSWDNINKQLLIHGAFIIGAISMIVIEYLHAKAEQIEHSITKTH